MEDFERYSRQIILPGFGTEAQQRLQQASVLVIGAGGLGCPALQYLAGAGVGRIGIMDGDAVSLTNLHRQLLFAESDIGKNKADAAAERLRIMNTGIQVTAMPYSITHTNACDLVAQYDLVLDASDNFATRYLVNDACVLMQKPFVYGAVSGYEGQVSFFNMPGTQTRFVYRDLFPDPPAAHEVPSCAEAGVLGVLPGIIGTMQATEAIKYLAGIGNLLHGRLLTYNLLQMQWYEMEITKQAKPVIDRASFEQEMDAAACDMEEDIPEISMTALLERKEREDIYILDVREKHEYPPIPFADAQVPMSELKEKIDSLPDRDLYIICHQGIRSLYAAQLIRARRGLTVYSVKGGITAYYKQQRS